MREHGNVTRWFTARLDLPEGGRIEVLAVVADDCVAIEEVRAQPPLSLDDLAVLADWIEEPLFRACATEPGPAREPAEAPATGDRPPWPRGIEGLRLVAEEYLAAQKEGDDPVYAVMSATGRSRRRALKLIAGAREAGFLTPRHIRC